MKLQNFLVTISHSSLALPSLRKAFLLSTLLSLPALANLPVQQPEDMTTRPASTIVAPAPATTEGAIDESPSVLSTAHFDEGLVDGMLDDSLASAAHMVSSFSTTHAANLFLKTERQALLSQQSAVQQKKVLAQNEVESLEESLKSFQKTLDETKVEITTLAAQVTELEEKVQLLNEGISQKEGAVTASMAGLKVHGNEIELRQAALKQQQDALTSQRIELAQTQGELTDTQHKLIVLEQKEKSSQDQVEQATTRQEVARQKVQALVLEEGSLAQQVQTKTQQMHEEVEAPQAAMANVDGPTSDAKADARIIALQAKGFIDPTKDFSREVTQPLRNPKVEYKVYPGERESGILDLKKDGTLKNPTQNYFYPNPAGIEPEVIQYKIDDSITDPEEREDLQKIYDLKSSGEMAGEMGRRDYNDKSEWVKMRDHFRASTEAGKVIDDVGKSFKKLFKKKNS